MWSKARSIPLSTASKIATCSLPGNGESVKNNRKAKFYRPTPKGRKELAAATSRWRQMTRAIGLILGESTD